MKLNPETLGFRLVLKPIGFKKVSDGGIDLSAIDARTHAINTDKGEVFLIGPSCWDRLERKPEIKAGDKVMYAKWGAKIIVNPEDKEDIYIIVNDEDILVGYE